MPLETERGYKVTLSFAQRKVLWMLSERGGVQVLDLTNVNQEARDGVQELLVKGLITITPLIGREAKEYKLTDLGIQVVDQIREVST